MKRFMKLFIKINSKAKNNMKLTRPKKSLQVNR